ncbi:MAG: prepilin-type N-terminal cleavage/methylation domain-containing protein [Planctomycetales bacterium]|nr:prepilin-type N-terminal cleavage/methylation domain-containing protein [Planctomycetales bacterium]
MNDSRANRRAFTLLEVILAISLSTVVLVLLATALDLLVNQVEKSRSRVEASQLARGILNQIASDLRSTYYYVPANSETSDEQESDQDNEKANNEGAVSQILGIYGTTSQIRIDRAAVWRWEHFSRDQSKPAKDATADQMPQTIRYFLNEGDTVLAENLAAEGIQEDTSMNYTGLAREQMSTAAWISQTDSSEADSSEAVTKEPQLLAPEVLEISFAYYDGEELLEEWDTAKNEGLPQAIEVTLKLANERAARTSQSPIDDPEALLPQVEDANTYRLFIRIPRLRPRPEVAGPRGLEQPNK